MKRRETITPGEYYHVFNRGIEKRRIFFKKVDYERFINSLTLFNTDKPSWLVNDILETGAGFFPTDAERLVELVAYCVNSNHFHLLLKVPNKRGQVPFL
jgi:putative transposase